MSNHCPRSRLVLLSLVVFVHIYSLRLAAQETPFRFENVARSSGLIPTAANIQAHGAGWGDIDGSGTADLYIATFHYTDTQPNTLLLNKSGSFEPANQESVQISTRGTGVLFADFDNDQDLDLYVASMPGPAESKVAMRHGHPFRGCQLFENDGQGNLSNVSHENEACPLAFGGRSATVLDYDGDGLLDLLVGEEPGIGYNGSTTHRSRLFRNLGKLQFEDVTDAVGIPDEAAGLGVAVGDVNQDTWPDILICSTLGNHLLINDQHGKFVAIQDREVFSWPDAKGDNMVCGVAISDINNDRWPDIVIGQHFDHPWKEPVANRLYLNKGLKDGHVEFVDITEKAGLIPLPLKAPHVEIQDFNNDGYQDVFCSIVTFADGSPHPLIFAGQGNEDGIPKFQQYAIGVNDFPNDADRKTRGSRGFFDKMLSDGKVMYAAPAPSCDYDRDGRLDMFFGSWWAEVPSMLLRNTSPIGNWIEIELRGEDGINSMGVGSRVDIYPAGMSGQLNELLGSKEIATGYGYASSQQAIAHFGLSKSETVDVMITLPHGGGQIIKGGLTLGQRHTIEITRMEEAK